MRILFMGTPDFAVPSLNRLCEDGHEILAVFTQPDKPKGRKQTLTPPPVKLAAQERGIPVLQPSSLKGEEAAEEIRGLSPEMIVVVAYGKILPRSILEIPPRGCINVHGSLLPKYRGAAPIQRAVVEGETVTGVTVMQMDAGMDTGDMLLKKETPIDPLETGGALYERLSHIGAQTLHEALEGLLSGRVSPIRQEEAEASYSPMLTKADSVVDWSAAAQAVHNRVRGLNPWPSAKTLWDGKGLKLHKTVPSGEKCPGAKPGEVVKTAPLTVACGDGYGVVLLEVQLEGGKRMGAEDFLRGNRMEAGVRLS